MFLSEGNQRIIFAFLNKSTCLKEEKLEMNICATAWNLLDHLLPLGRKLKQNLVIKCQHNSISSTISS